MKLEDFILSEISQQRKINTLLSCLMYPQLHPLPPRVRANCLQEGLEAPFQSQVFCPCQAPHPHLSRLGEGSNLAPGPCPALATAVTVRVSLQASHLLNEAGCVSLSFETSEIRQWVHTDQLLLPTSRRGGAGAGRGRPWKDMTKVLKVNYF